MPDDKREFKHVDAVLKFLGVMTGDKEYENLLNNPNFKKEGANMCSVVQNLKEEGRTEANINAIRFMITNFNATKSDVLKQYSEDEYNAAMKLISNTKK